jgi:hypothetical protein
MKVAYIRLKYRWAQKNYTTMPLPFYLADLPFDKVALAFM